MPGPRSSYIPLNLSFSGTATGYVEAAVPVAGVIKEVWVGSNVLMTTGTLAVAKGSTNILSAASVNLAASGGDVTAGTAASQTLATAATTKRVAAGDILKATWTVTSAGSFVCGSCLVFIEPDLI